MRMVVITNFWIDSIDSVVLAYVEIVENAGTVL